MANLAVRTKGNFYNVTNPRALPRIYQKEARSISRPLIFEQTTPWQPKINYPITEPVTGLTDDLPAITGAGADLAQGKRAGRDPARVATANRSAKPGPGALDLRLGAIGRLHVGRRATVGKGLARLEELCCVLVPGHPMGDEARRPRQPHSQRPPRRGAGSKSSSTRWIRKTSSSTSCRSKGISGQPRP